MSTPPEGLAPAAPERPRGSLARRPRTHLLLPLLLLVALLGAACDQWNGIGRGAARTSHNSAEQVLDAATVPTVTEQWRAAAPVGSHSQPAIVDGRVHVASGTLRTYDLAGAAGCGGGPTTCTPLWTSADTGLTSVTVSGGLAYAVGGGWLRVYAADGSTGCTGSPGVCLPLWSAALGGHGSSAAVADGVVYVTSDRLAAFDAAGCASISGLCDPLWTSTVPVRNGAAVSGGVVYGIGDLGTIVAFDAFGVAGCSGSPTSCAPVRTYQFTSGCSVHGCAPVGPPSVDGGRLYVLSTDCCSMGLGAVRLHAFDATGASACSGSPVVCGPVGHTTVPSDNLPIARPPLAVANGVVYASTTKLHAFDAASLTWQWGTSSSVASPPSAAKGVVHVIGFVSEDGATKVRSLAFDDGGGLCTGNPPSCVPIWSSPSTPTSTSSLTGSSLPAPAVAEGRIVAHTAELVTYG